MPYTQVCVHLVITWSIILLIVNLLTPLGAAVNVLIAVTASFSVMKYRERALAMIEKKVEGQEIKAVAPAPRRSGQVVDIFAALKNNDISKLASKRKIRVRSFSRAKVKHAFSDSGASNKYDIAIAIAGQFPELAPRLPRFRKPWMSKDYRMSISDAVFQSKPDGVKISIA